ncbi:MAG: flagellar basal body-associated protein FliL [Burkholderiaceae bacterium]|nr:flagellar basal body-associated protein FliL [Burkholderiaceae bacterium]
MATASKSRSIDSPDESDDSVAPKKSKKKLLLVLIVVLILLGAGGGGAWYWFMIRGTDASVTQKKPDPPVFISMEAFTVNLQPEGGEHYLQTTITLQVAEKADVDLFKLYTPQVRNRILLLLSSKKASEISSVEGKKKLAEEIVAAVNQPFTQDGKPQSASSVLFTSFIIQ